MIFGEVMAVIVTACYDIPHAGELVTMLKTEVDGLKSIVQNINKKRTNIIMGTKNRVLYGKSTIKGALKTVFCMAKAQLKTGLAI